MKENRTPAPRPRNLSRRGLLTGVGVAGGGLILGSAFPLTTFADDDEHEQSCNAGELCSSPDPIPHVNEAVLAGFGVKAHFFFPGPVEARPRPPIRREHIPAVVIPLRFTTLKGL
jgi:hypothetical protein